MIEKGRLCMCLCLTMGIGKRQMRSNRRETWGSLNLPPWLSTFCMISLYCLSLCSLQIFFICDGNFGVIKPKCREVMSNFLQEFVENCSPLMALIHLSDLSLMMMLWCHTTPSIVRNVCMMFFHEKITPKLHERKDF